MPFGRRRRVAVSAPSVFGPGGMPDGPWAERADEPGDGTWGPSARLARAERWGEAVVILFRGVRASFPPLGNHAEGVTAVGEVAASPEGS